MYWIEKEIVYDIPEGKTNIPSSDINRYRTEKYYVGGVGMYFKSQFEAIDYIKKNHPQKYIEYLQNECFKYTQKIRVIKFRCKNLCNMADSILECTAELSREGMIRWMTSFLTRYSTLTTDEIDKLSYKTMREAVSVYKKILVDVFTTDLSVARKERRDIYNTIKSLKK